MRYHVGTRLVAAICVAGCGGSRGATSVVHDSAGISIAESRSPAGIAFSIDSAPTLDVGPAAGSSSEFATSPLSVIRLANGALVAAGWATTEMRLFDGAGRWIRTVGRRGSGPGEFEGLGFVFQGPGDTLVTYEPGTERVQRWHPDGAFLSFSHFAQAPGRPGGWITGVFDDGSLLIESSRSDHRDDTQPAIRSQVTLFRAPVGGGKWDSLFSYPGVLRMRHPIEPTWTFGNPLFTPVPGYHQRAGRIAFAAGDRFEVRIYSANGILQQIVRRSTLPRTISSAEFDKAAAAFLSLRPAATRDRFRARLLETSTSRVRPPVSGVWLAGDGRLWATFGENDIGERVQASVFDSAGHWEGDVALPPGFEINQIDADGLLGTVVDSQGFRHIRFHRFIDNRRAGVLPRP
ncbi:MAG: hypothetical protein V4558_03595 [Gemmatimonadota bacterium]